MDVMQAARWLIGATLVVGIVWLCNRVNNSHLMTLFVGGPRVEVAFAAGHKGEVVETPFHVPRDEYFAITLDLYFKSDDPADRARVENLARRTERDPEGMPIGEGVPIPVKLTIAQMTPNGPALLVSREFSHLYIEGWTSSYFLKTVFSTPLKKGDYTIRIESLADIPELADTPIKFDVRIPGNRK